MFSGSYWEGVCNRIPGIFSIGIYEEISLQIHEKLFTVNLPETSGEIRWKISERISWGKEHVNFSEIIHVRIEK